MIFLVGSLNLLLSFDIVSCMTERLLACKNLYHSSQKVLLRKRTEVKLANRSSF